MRALQHPGIVRVCTMRELQQLWSQAATVSGFHRLIASKEEQGDLRRVSFQVALVAAANSFMLPCRDFRENFDADGQGCVRHQRAEKNCSTCWRIHLSKYATAAAQSSIKRGMFVGLCVMFWDLRGPMPVSFQGNRYLFVGALLEHAVYDEENELWKHDGYLVCTIGIKRKTTASVLEGLHIARTELRIPDGCSLIHCVQ